MTHVLHHLHWCAITVVPKCVDTEKLACTTPPQERATAQHQCHHTRVRSPQRAYRNYEGQYFLEPTANSVLGWP